MNKYLVLFFGLLFCACDPPHYIDFENQSKSEVVVTFIKNTDIENWDFYEFRDIMKGDSIILKVDSGKTETLHFGIGTWSESEIELLTNSIDQIIIENNDFKQVYKSNNSIRSLLTNDMSGFWWKTKIYVHIE